MNIKIMKIYENITEKDFPKYLKNLGYSCKKIKYSNHKSIEKSLRANFNCSKGMPDFYVYNKKEKFLCEFKSLIDSWQPHQIEWAMNNSNIPLTLALVLPEKDRKDLNEKNNTLIIDTKSEEENKKIERIHKIQNKILISYVHKHPEIINKELFRNFESEKESYFGMIPLEVSKKWKEVKNKLRNENHFNK